MSFTLSEEQVQTQAEETAQVETTVETGAETTTETQVETTQVETTATAETTTAAETTSGSPEKEAIEQEPKLDLKKAISEAIGGEFEDLESVKNYIDSRKGYVEPKNELWEKANAFAESPEKLATFLQVQGIDVETLDNRDAIILDMKFSKPYLNDEQIQALVSKDLPLPTKIDEESMTEEEIRDAKQMNTIIDAELAVRATDAKKNLSELKTKWEPPTQEEVAQAQNDRLAGIKEAHQNGVKKAMETFKGSTTKLGEDGEFAYVPGENDADLVKSTEHYASDLNALQLELGWFNEKGEANFDRMTQDVFKLLSYERQINSAYTRGQSEAVNEILDLAENPTPIPTQTETGENGKPPSLHEQFEKTRRR